MANKVAHLKCTVQTFVGSYDFATIVHCAETPGEQRISPEFYEKADGVHESVHHELELVVWPCIPLNAQVHIHTEPTGKYLCYTPQVKTVEEAEDLFKVWCVGTAYTLEEHKDFASVAENHPDDFLEFMESLGISIFTYSAV